MKKGCTHIIRSYEGVRETAPGIEAKFKVEDLYRADGMMVACRQDELIRFGSDISTAQNRPFLDDDTASRFLRLLADVDLVCAEEGKPMHLVIDRYLLIPEGVAIIEVQDGSTKDIERVDGSIAKVHLVGRPGTVRLH